jgi:hypothetical protein
MLEARIVVAISKRGRSVIDAEVIACAIEASQGTEAGEIIWDLVHLS